MNKGNVRRGRRPLGIASVARVIAIDDNLGNLAVLAKELGLPQSVLGAKGRGKADGVDQIAADDAHVAQLVAILRGLVAALAGHGHRVVAVGPAADVHAAQAVRAASGAAARLLLSQPLPLPLLGGRLGLVGLDDLLHVDGTELVRVVAVRGAAGRTKAGLGLLDPVPAPHANLVATFARVELLVGYVEILAAQRTYVALCAHWCWVWLGAQWCGVVVWERRQVSKTKTRTRQKRVRRR